MSDVKEADVDAEETAGITETAGIAAIDPAGVAPVEETANETDEDSLDELVARRATSRNVDDEGDDGEGDPEDVPVVLLPREEPKEVLEAKVRPIQRNEFVCARCDLVKHRVQLADRERTLCRDCA